MFEEDRLRLQRTKRLAQPLRKKLKSYEIGTFSKEEFLQRLIDVSDFPIDSKAQKWFIETCKNNQELFYAFQLLFQRAINQGHLDFLWEDFHSIVKNIDFSFMNHHSNQSIGTVYTLGIIEDKVEKIKIRCCAIPVSRKKGRILCTQKLSIRNLPIKESIKDYNIYIKFYPERPENDGKWEAALMVALYSAVYNKILPSPSFILGGITKKGEITPIDISFEKFMDQEGVFEIFISNKSKKNLNLQKHFLYPMIYVEDIKEIVSMMKEVPLQ